MPIENSRALRRELHDLTSQARRLLAALELGDDRTIRTATTQLAETINKIGPSPGLLHETPTTHRRRRSPTAALERLARTPLTVLSSGQVAALCDVSINTVGYWAAAGYLPSTRTPGGHFRFEPDDVRDFLAERGRALTVAA